jgi:CHAT domain
MRVSEVSVGLLGYFVGTEHIYAVLLNHRGESQRFCLADCRRVWPKIEALLDVLNQPQMWRSSYPAERLLEFSEDWGGDLLPPHDALQPFDVLIIVPHHFMHGIPIHLVKSGNEPLCRILGVAYCSSGTLFARCAERNRARLFDADNWTFPWGEDGTAPNGPAISTCLSYGIDVLTDNDVAYMALAQRFAGKFPHNFPLTSRTHLINALARNGNHPTEPDAICIVCHAYHDVDKPERSGLLLGGDPFFTVRRGIEIHGGCALSVCDEPFADVPLRLDLDPFDPAHHGLPGPDVEVMTGEEVGIFANTHAQLVALFGCSTGTGKVAGGDAFVSHSYQWLKAGYPSVVSNLWEADFQVVGEWGDLFAANWVNLRQPKALAAREATLQLLSNRPELEQRPDLWGCLCLMGDWL